MLRCCERLVTELAVEGEPDPVVVEAVWTTALLSYARCFSATGDGVALTEKDVASDHSRAGRGGGVAPAAAAAARPLRRPGGESAGAVLGRGGAGRGRPASGVGITSARQPLVDDLTVRQTGAIAYALSGLVNERIEARQQRGLRRPQELVQGGSGQAGPARGGAAPGRRRRRPDS